jgi:superfamily I DNA/RNA helicase
LSLLRLVFDKTLYLRAARELRDNEGQWAAYQSTGHCVILAGPGSGKTKTLTIKLARMLNEDVEAPRGIACITYSSECAKELESRLAALGIEPTGRVFIGTVHSFSLTQIILPYAKSANLDLPSNFRVATQNEQRHALEDAFTEVVGGPEQPQRWRLRLDNHRRSILNRNSAEWRTSDPQLSRLVEAYESQLRARGLIDFDDMTLIALRALKEHEWLQKAILAKYPILAVDEYQDLGRALHQMVLGLCFRSGIRLLAVGDVDQSIYGFNGAYPELLQRLAERDDVETIRLRLNYRCGSRIVTASSYALGEDRDYAAPEGAHEGLIFFHPLHGTYKQQATFLFREILPAARGRIANLAPGDIGILYPKGEIGNSVAEAAQAYGHSILRTDTNSLYPRSSKLIRWLELCAVWCCGGWQTGVPRFRRISSDGGRLFSEVLRSPDTKVLFQRTVIQYLWETRDSTLRLNTWLERFGNTLLNPLLAGCRMLDDEPIILEDLIKNTRAGGSAAGMTLGQFSGHGEGNDRINLSTLHSAKGREWPLVVMMAMDYGEIPWRNIPPKRVLEARRLFYVGFTRAKVELHLVFTAGQKSPFVEEVQNRLLLS